MNNPPSLPPLRGLVDFSLLPQATPLSLLFPRLFKLLPLPRNRETWLFPPPFLASRPTPLLFANTSFSKYRRMSLFLPRKFPSPPFYSVSRPYFPQVKTAPLSFLQLAVIPQSRPSPTPDEPLPFSSKNTGTPFSYSPLHQKPATLPPPPERHSAPPIYQSIFLVFSLLPVREGHPPSHE